MLNNILILGIMRIIILSLILLTISCTDTQECELEPLFDEIHNDIIKKQGEGFEKKFASFTKHEALSYKQNYFIGRIENSYYSGKYKDVLNKIYSIDSLRIDQIAIITVLSLHSKLKGEAMDLEVEIHKYAKHYHEKMGFPNLDTITNE